MPKHPTVRTIHSASDNTEIVRSAAELLEQIWPGRGIDARIQLLHDRLDGFDGPPSHRPMHFVMVEDDAVIAHAGTFARDIATPAGGITALALWGVCVNPSIRGRGLGKAVVASAIARIDQGQFTHGLWQTESHVVAFYEKLGAREVTNRFINSLAKDPQANPWWDGHVLVYPAEADWPDGVIDMCGPGY